LLFKNFIKPTAEPSTRTNNFGLSIEGYPGG